MLVNSTEPGGGIVINYLLKLMSGKLLYSECFLEVLRRGKVQRNALASRLLICCWLRLMEWVLCCLSRGMPWVTSCGSLRASCTTFGSKFSKKYSVSKSSRAWQNIQGFKQMEQIWKHYYRKLTWWWKLFLMRSSFQCWSHNFNAL